MSSQIIPYFFCLRIHLNDEHKYFESNAWNTLFRKKQSEEKVCSINFNIQKKKWLEKWKKSLMHINTMWIFLSSDKSFFQVFSCRKCLATISYCTLESEKTTKIKIQLVNFSGHLNLSVSVFNLFKSVNLSRLYIFYILPLRQNSDGLADGEKL